VVDLSHNDNHSDGCHRHQALPTVLVTIMSVWMTFTGVELQHLF